MLHVIITIVLLIPLIGLFIGKPKDYDPKKDVMLYLLLSAILIPISELFGSRHLSYFFGGVMVTLLFLGDKIDLKK